MLKHLTKVATALVLGLVLNCAAHAQEVWWFNEIYSNGDGSVQFIVFSKVAVNYGGLLGGQTLISSASGVEHRFVFGGSSPAAVAEGTFTVLVGTQGFADLNLVKPDFVVPNGFLFTSDASISIGFCEAHYTMLPTDGTLALYPGGCDGSVDADPPSVSPATVTNFAGQSYYYANFAGLWWSAPGGSESGWGISFADAGDRVFATWYTYDTTGKAWWLSMLAPRVSGNTFVGTLYVDSGPRFDNFIGAGTASAVGWGSVTFTDANTGSFEYTVNGVHQTKAIIRYDLGSGPRPTCAYGATTPDLAAATNYQGLWWEANGAESGWGLNLVHDGSNIFATWFTYDIDRSPLWLSTLMQRLGTTHVYEGELLRTAGSRFDNYRASDLQPLQNVGTASLTFADGNHAMFDYRVQLSGMPILVEQSKSITRFPLAASGGTVCY